MCCKVISSFCDICVLDLRVAEVVLKRSFKLLSFFTIICVNVECVYTYGKCSGKRRRAVWYLFGEINLDVRPPGGGIEPMLLGQIDARSV